MTDIRVGNGWDFHRFGPGEFVRLGTLDVPHSHSLIGDTDADIVLHALVDALCGALGTGEPEVDQGRRGHFHGLLV